MKGIPRINNNAEAVKCRIEKWQIEKYFKEKKIKKKKIENTKHKIVPKFLEEKKTTAEKSDEVQENKEMP